MKLLILCVIINAMDFVFDIRVRNKTYKAFADLGYIFNYKKYIYILNAERKSAKFWTRFLLDIVPYIPIYNLYHTYFNFVKFTMYTEELVEPFNSYGIIEKMTTNELKEYSLDKSSRNAKILEKKMHKRRHNAFPVIYEDGSSIWYTEDDNAEDLKSSIKIVESRGMFEKAPLEVLVDMVYDAQLSFAKVILDTCEDDEMIDKQIAYDLENVSHNDYTNDNNKVKKRIRKK